MKISHFRFVMNNEHTTRAHHTIIIRSRRRHEKHFTFNKSFFDHILYIFLYSLLLGSKFGLLNNTTHISELSWAINSVHIFHFSQHQHHSQQLFNTQQYKNSETIGGWLFWSTHLIYKEWNDDEYEEEKLTEKKIIIIIKLSRTSQGNRKWIMEFLRYSLFILMLQFQIVEIALGSLADISLFIFLSFHLNSYIV